MKEKLKTLKIRIKIWLSQFIPFIAAEVMFENIRAFTKCDGIKWALYYGKFIYLRSEHDTRGNIMLKERSKKADELIDQLRNPTDRLKYIAFLEDIRAGVIQANLDGFFSAGDNRSINKEEAAKYDNAIGSLNKMIAYCKHFPITWKRIYLRP